MTASVREAAELLTAIAGSDPADPATARPTSTSAIMPPALDANSLKGKRIGVMRFASGFGTDAAFETALAVLREKGAILVEIKKFDDKRDRQERAAGPADRAQGRHGHISEGQPGADPASARSPT